MPVPSPDDFANSGYFAITLDGDPLKEESWFHEVQGLNMHIDQIDVQEGGKNDGCHKRPGSTRFENIVFKRGVSASKALFTWISNASRRDVKRMGGKITLKKKDGTPMIEWTFEKGFPCRYEGATLRSDGSNTLAIETIEIAHEGLKLQA